MPRKKGRPGRSRVRQPHGAAAPRAGSARGRSAAAVAAAAAAAATRTARSWTGAPSGGKRTARPATAGKESGAAAIITEPEHKKERVKLEGCKCKGQLLIFGATNWDLIGRKEVPKQQAAYPATLVRICGGPIDMDACQESGCEPWFRAHVLPTASSSPQKGSSGAGVGMKRGSWAMVIPRGWKPPDPSALSHEAIVLAACGRNHTLALTDTGSVFTFGENKMRQLGLGNQTDAVPSPAQIM